MVSVTELTCVKDWLGSHPSIVPCDVSPYTALKRWQADTLPDHDYASEFSWALAPRVPIGHDDWEWRGYGLRTLNRTLGDGNFTRTPHERFREYFLLRGLIYKWKMLYGKVADENSWVWNWFPDGQRWLSEVRRHGLDVLDKVIQR
jgi:hypothetical protein